MAYQLISNYRKPHKDILQYPNPILRKVSTNVEKIDDNTRKIANELIKVVKELDKPFVPWLGMAAPQISHNERIIVIKKGYRNYLVMVNPEIKQQKISIPTISGCFSLPGLYLTKAHLWFRIKYQDLNGNYHTDVFWGGQAVLLQQEIDHLNGKLVCD